MKRVERRGTLENQQLQNAAMQQFQPRPTSLAQPVGPQSSDRTIQRSDTLLINQPSLGPSSFTQPRLEQEGPHQRSSTGNPVSSGKNSRHPPTPPAIASLRQDDDDEHDDEHDEQPPTSNVGRGSGRAVAPSTVQSRSNSRNGRGNGNANANAKKSGQATTNHSSNSPAAGDADVDEVDADADADAEADGEAEMGAADGDGDADADADAELLEAVDAAEASGSSHGGDRSWFKSEA